MENSDFYNHEKFIVYFEGIYEKLPPYGKPREFIDKYATKKLNPY